MDDEILEALQAILKEMEKQTVILESIEMNTTP